MNVTLAPDIAVDHVPLDRQLADYWAQSRRPLVSLAFIAPLLICYELGVVSLGVQNGADVWMRKWLDSLGFSQHFLLPLLTVAVLLGWHHLTHFPWRVSAPLLALMAVECIAMAAVLWLIFRLQGKLFSSIGARAELSIGGRIQEAVGFLGAGIYEELLFRVVLLSAVIGLFSFFRFRGGWGLATAIISTSLLFAAAHYVGANGDSLRWFSFVFRFLAGAFFSVVFVYRGFGIAAGTHAGYDILVSLFAALG